VTGPLVEVAALTKHYPVGGGLFGGGKVLVRANDEVTFTIPRGQALGLVGESGSGKSTVGKVMLRLHEPTSGRFRFDGTEVFDLAPGDLRQLRARMQIVQQNPDAALHPSMTIRQQVGRPLALRSAARGAALRDRVVAMLEQVGLRADHADRMPHEFSGGQRQRIAIARGLITSPEFLILDEPTSALDVSVQAQILRLLADLRVNNGLSYLFISHELGVVRYMCDHVAVMYLGRIVELAPVADLFGRPLHPYTKALISVVPVPDPAARHRPRTPLRGEIPSAARPPPGCHFHTRCPIVTEECRRVAPPLRWTQGGHAVACHHADLPG